MQTKHGDAFVKFNETFPPAVVDKWERMVAEWDADKSKKNPYEEPVAGASYIYLTRNHDLPNCRNNDD
jgi:hypothetical protein